MILAISLIGYITATVIGRANEQVVLERVLASKAAQFLAVYGRRRIGKTYLIRNFFSKRIKVMEVTGSLRGSKEQQLRSFIEALQECFAPKLDLPIPASWHEAFRTFTSAVEKSGQPILLFLDELPWLATRDSELLSELDHFWNRHWSRIENFKLVVCGSATHWILDHIVNETGGLHNRLTASLLLKPLTLGETKDYLGNRGISYSDSDIIDLYICLGGIPYYLDLIPRNLSVAEAIQQLCFEQSAALSNEFELMLDALFKNSDGYRLILSALASARYGLNTDSISKITKIESGGALSKKLSELEACQFIKKYVPFGRKTRDSYFRIIDEFTVFYHTWMQTLTGQVSLEPNYWFKRFSSTRFSTWAGYNFETVVHKHSHSVLQRLGISGMSSSISHWQGMVPNVEDQEPQKFQIDLVIDRADRVVNLCEVKYSRNPYVISRELIRQIGARSAAFQSATKTKKSISNVLIISNELASKSTDSVIAKTITGAELFTG